jgi:hypothetical protein
MDIVKNDHDPSTVQYAEEQQPSVLALAERLSNVQHNYEEQTSWMDCSLDCQAQETDQAAPTPPTSDSVLPLPPPIPLPHLPSPSPPPSPPLSRPPSLPPPPLSLSPQLEKPPKESTVSSCDSTWNRIFGLVYTLGLPYSAAGECSADYMRILSNASKHAFFSPPNLTTGLEVY